MLTPIIEGFRLSPQQAYLWSLQQGSSAYTARCAISLVGRVEAPFLNEAIRRVIARHETLRTSFLCFDTLKVPLQVISSDCSFSLDEIDLSSLDTRAQTAHIDQAFDLTTAAPLESELKEPPLLRGTLTLSSIARILDPGWRITIIGLAGTRQQRSGRSRLLQCGVILRSRSRTRRLSTSADDSFGRICPAPSC